MVMIVFAYLCCFSAFVHNVLLLYNQDFTQLKDYDNEKSYEILQNMSRDRYICHCCINPYTSNTLLENMSNKHDLLIEKEKRLVNFRVVIIGFELFTLVVIFFVYGGPAIINILSIISVLCAFAAQYETSVNVVVILESFVLLVASVTFLQSLYTILVTILDVHTCRFMIKND